MDAARLRKAWTKIGSGASVIVFLKGVVMTRILMGALLTICLFSQVEARRCYSCLDKRLPDDNMRHHTFKAVLERLERDGARTLVETGTSRYGDGNCAGDGCSTLIFGEWADQNGATLYSVDKDPKALNNAKKALMPHVRNKECVQFVESDSIAFLRDFGQPIDFLYLDSRDYGDWDPHPSQRHCLNELIAAYPNFTEKTFVMVDDSCFPRGGKGKLVVKYLKDRGWRVLIHSYQVILCPPED